MSKDKNIIQNGGDIVIEENSPFTAKPDGAGQQWAWTSKVEDAVGAVGGVIGLLGNVLNLGDDKPDKETTYIQVPQQSTPQDNTSLWLGLGLGGLALIVFVIIMLKK